MIGKEIAGGNAIIVMTYNGNQWAITERKEHEIGIKVFIEPGQCKGPFINNVIRNGITYRWPKGDGIYRL